MRLPLVLQLLVLGGSQAMHYLIFLMKPVMMNARLNQIAKMQRTNV
jgi:hypothetical protein